MLVRSVIESIIDSQKERIGKLDAGLKRDFSDYPSLSSHALIITGIRRCGKSTLLQQINRAAGVETLFLNFEDPRLAGFDAGDFNRLQEIITKHGINVLFFDEIQNIDKWENFVRFRLDEGYKVYITGSNASMLSRELGTRLTGRHISKELFPFSYSEYLAFKGETSGVQTADDYMHGGGFPEAVKTGIPEILMQAFNDIVIRDIAVRYGIKNISMLQQLAVWLISNAGKPVTGNSLRKMFSIGSSASIMEYLSYFADAYLFFFVPVFSYSQKVQLVNPRKVYVADNGMIEVNSLSFGSDNGRLLENMVYLQLRRMTNKICYFSGKKECDFVVFGKDKTPELYQVCLQLDEENTGREVNGLSEAMDFFSLTKGTIITREQSDIFKIDKKVVTVLPFYKWGSDKL
ncbi:MAG: ATP-binding protein [Bacteroidales bacterium]|nr:ATP-binding protein [Bacteroidales bacterium]